MIAVVFPGQGSQRPGMGKELAELHPGKTVFGEVSDAVGTDVLRLCTESDEDTLRQTQNAQLALFTCGMAAYAVIADQLSASVAAMAGHSVGEYAAVAAAGAVSIADAARLVKRRGELMAQSGVTAPGTMAAVLGLERDALHEVCEQTEGIVVIANDNCPGQLVISGQVEAVKRASEGAVAKGAKRVLPLNVSGAFHSPLMASGAKELALALASVSWSQPRVPVFSNVTAQPVQSASEIPELLSRQLESPVRWTESVLAMRAAGIERFVECGAGEVLIGLLKRIDREAKGVAVHDLATVAALEATP
jgi:[acyl-carrier-protein] S-malonyltransferase